MKPHIRLCLFLLCQLMLIPVLYGQAHIIYPNGNETFLPGKNVVIRWDGVDESVVVSLEYSTDNGESWQGITSRATGLQYQWRIPNTPSNRCLIRLTSSDPGTIYSGHPFELDEALFSYNERQIVAAGAGTVVCWDVESKQILWRSDSINFMKVNPSGPALVGLRDRKVAIRDIMTGSVTKYLEGHTNLIANVRYSPDGAYIATSSSDRTARLWNGSTGELSLTLSGHKGDVKVTRFSANSRRVVTLAEDSTLKVWDVEGGSLIRTIKNNRFDWFWTAMISPLGDAIAAIEELGDSTLTIWDVESGTIRYQLRGKRYVHFSPDGRQIVTGDIGSGALVYNAMTGSLLFSLGRHAGSAHRASYSHDSKLLATADSDGGLNIWNAETGQFLRKLIGHKRGVSVASGIVASAEFSKDGRRLLTSGEDKTVRIWDLENLAQVTDVSDATFTILPSTLAVTQIDMGTVKYGLSRDSVVTAVIRNPDNQLLRVENLRVTGKDSLNFSMLPDTSPIEVPAGGSADLKLRFTPSGAGQYEAVLRMNVPNALQISLRGQGVLVPMLPQLDTIDFGPREMFREVDTTVVVVRNMTEEDIHIDSVTVRGAFGIWPHVRDTVLKAGAALSVRIECRMLGPYIDVRPLQIIYKAGDEDQDTVVLTVRGEGVRPASVGEERSVSRGVTIHPNPAGDRGTVEFAVDKASKIRMALWDVLGRRVQDEDLGELPEGLHRHELDLRAIGSGTYLLIVETASGRIISSLRVVR